MRISRPSELEDPPLRQSVGPSQELYPPWNTYRWIDQAERGTPWATPCVVVDRVQRGNSGVPKFHFFGRIAGQESQGQESGPPCDLRHLPFLAVLHGLPCASTWSLSSYLGKWVQVPGFYGVMSHFLR